MEIYDDDDNDDYTVNALCPWIILRYFTVVSGAEMPRVTAEAIEECKVGVLRHGIGLVLSQISCFM